MNRLIFRYGTMNSSKTMNLLALAHNYEKQKKEFLVIKPSQDSRFEGKLIKCRAGLKREADLVISKNDNILELIPQKNFFCILVDEAQFLTKYQVQDLKFLSRVIMVICYGLRTDFRSKLFSGSQRLMEIADSIEEIETICSCINCYNKAIVNAKYKRKNGGDDIEIIKYGRDKIIEIGSENLYKPMCWICWEKM